MYAKAHILLNKPGWKHHKRMVDQEKRYIKMMKRACAAKASNGTHMKFGIEVPKNFKDALRIDTVNGNKVWEEAIKTKLLPLGDDLTFICGHGPMSTIGDERRSNPFLA